MSAKGKRKPCFSSILDSEDEEEIDDDIDIKSEIEINDDFLSAKSATNESDDVLGELSTSVISSTGNQLSCRRHSTSESSTYLDSAYDSVSSPGGSSTASGPTYIRTAGFENHAHEIIAIPVAGTGNSCAPMDVNDTPVQPKSKHFPISKKGNNISSKSSKLSSFHSSSSSSRKSISSNSPSPVQSSDSCSPISSASSTSSSTSSREPLILRGVKKKKALLLNASTYSEETVINNGKSETKPINGNNRRGKLGSNTSLCHHLSNHRPKNKKEPLPMKQRALPQSFWQEPNIVANSQAPGSAYSTLPPLDLGGAVGVGGLSLIDDHSVEDESSNSIVSMEELSQRTTTIPPSMSSSMVSSSSQLSSGANLIASQSMSTSLCSLNDISGIRRPSNPVPPREKLMITSPANTDLLFSLFNSVEEEEAQRRIHVVRRGRPKKVPSTVNATKIVHIDDDPCLNSIVAESILPLIPERAVGNSSSFGTSTTDSSSSLSSGINDNIHTNMEGAMLKGKSGGSFNVSTSSNSRYSAKGIEGTQVIKIMSISNGDRSVELPSLNVEHNYPHLLSELVMKL